MRIHASIAAAIAVIGLGWCETTQAGSGERSPDPGLNSTGLWQVSAPGPSRYSLRFTPGGEIPVDVAGTFVGNDGVVGYVKRGASGKLTKLADAIDVGPYGGPGGTPFRWSCPAGMVLIGLAGRAGAWTDRIAGRCASWSPEQQTFIGDSITGPFFGTSDGGYWFSTVCPLSAVARIRSVTGDFIQDIQFRCRSIAPPTADTGTWGRVPYYHDASDASPGEFACPDGEVGVGINGRSGKFVDALGLICAPPPTGVAGPAPTPAPPPPAGVPMGKLKLPAKPGAGANFSRLWSLWLNSNSARYRMFLNQDIPGNVNGSLGGGTITGKVSGNHLVGTWSEGGKSGTVDLTMLANGGITGIMANLGTGGGTWSGSHPPADLPGGPTGAQTSNGKSTYRYPHTKRATGEPVFYDWCLEPGKGCGKEAADRFCATNGDGPAVDFKKFVQAGRFKPTLWSGSQKLCDYPDCQAFEQITCDGPVVATPAPPSTGGGSCGPPGGTAVVTIPDPKLTRLNVRASPGGKVLTTIPEGQTVSIVGECGDEPAAGIAKTLGKLPGQIPNEGGGTPGWCQIDAPVNGCVSAKFLAFDSPAGSAAGLAKQQLGKPSPAAVGGFAGSWDAIADGVAYQVTLDQKGSTVSGRYSGADGSAGTIAGSLKRNVLRFSWTQRDGQRGTGKFTLSGDGQSFAGSYNLGKNPDVVEGSWNGSWR